MNDKKLVIVSLVSKFHMHAAMSYVNKSNLFNQNNEFLILISYHEPSKMFRVNQNDFIKSTEIKINFEYLEGGKSVYPAINRKLKEEKYKEVTLINQVKENYTLLFLLKYYYRINKIKQVLVDEGIGIYYDDNLWNIEINAQYKKNYMTKRVYYNLKLIIKNLIRMMVVFWMQKTFKDIEKHYLFEKKNDVLILQENIADSFLDYFTNIKNDNMILDELKSDTILIISDNLGFYHNSQNEEIETYKKIIKRIKIKYPNHNIFIKPHPNESQNLNKFNEITNCTILDKAISVEDILNNNKIELLSGFCSTSLLISSQLFNVKTLSLVNYINEKELTEYGKLKIKTFKKLTSGLKKIRYEM